MIEKHLQTFTGETDSPSPLALFAGITALHATAAVFPQCVKPETVPHSAPDYAAARHAIRALWQDAAIPSGALSEIEWRRDPLGKPFVALTGSAARWAAATGRQSRDLHISNTHDGGAHIVIAGYGEDLTGLGIDAVWLPRLRRSGKDADYLRRFARQFMSYEERASFEAEAMAHNELRAAADGTDGVEALRLRVAAHFSLMEAASKACGTGLKIGVGMGGRAALPKRSLGVETLGPPVRLLFGPEAVQRMDVIGARRYEASVRVEQDFLVSVVVFYRTSSENPQNRAGGTLK